MVEEEPAAVGLNRCRAGADLKVFPPVFAPAHNVAVTSPEFEVLALGEEDVAKSRVTVVAGAGEHNVVSAYFSRKEYGIAVVGKERIFEPPERPEVFGLSDANRWTVSVLTPHNIISIAELHETRIVGVYRYKRLAVFVCERYLLWLKFPVYRVGALAEVDVGDTVALFTAENADEAVLERGNCAVEHAGDVWEGISAYNWVSRVSPDRGSTVRGLVLPGDIAERGADNMDTCHNRLLLLKCLKFKLIYVN